MRIGHGFDAHRFESGRDLVLGGVLVPYEKGLAAHSDGDVVIHAFCDALLGALAEGDIGQHFPDTDGDYKNIDSRLLLRHVGALINAKGWVLGNADLTVIAQAPKLAPHLTLMRERLSSDLHCAVSQISVKATTTEKMGYTGRGEGIAAHAVVLLTPSVI